MIECFQTSQPPSTSPLKKDLDTSPRFQSRQLPHFNSMDALSDHLIIRLRQVMVAPLSIVTSVPLASVPNPH